MNTLSLGLGAILLVALGVAAFIRFAPVDPGKVRPPEKRDSPGDYGLTGGHHAVRTLEEVDLSDLETRIAATARTKRLSGSAGDLPMFFLHRSAVWGFPDVTRVWLEDGNVHIYSHLIYGRSDLGVNRERMKGWLDG
jgi:hypothetical protein